MIDHEMNLEEAVSAGRFHHQWQPDRVIHEKNAFSDVTRGELIKMGHKNLNEVPAFYGGGIGDGNSVMSIDGGFHGMADPRNNGAAIGPSVWNEK